MAGLRHSRGRHWDTPGFSGAKVPRAALGLAGGRKGHLGGTVYQRSKLDPRAAANRCSPMKNPFFRWACSSVYRLSFAQQMRGAITEYASIGRRSAQSNVRETPEGTSFLALSRVTRVPLNYSNRIVRPGNDSKTIEAARSVRWQQVKSVLRILIETTVYGSTAQCLARNIVPESTQMPPVRLCLQRLECHLIESEYIRKERR